MTGKQIKGKANNDMHVASWVRTASLAASLTPKGAVSSVVRTASLGAMMVF